MKTIMIAAIALSAFSQNAFSHGRGDTYNYYEINKRYVYVQQRCVTEYRTVLSVTDRTAKACHINKPLHLAWTVKNYPNMKQNPRRVQYWEGDAAKTVATDYQILRELVDECRGKIISQNNIVETETHEVTFAIQNPNLDPEISESFMLAPMTDQEAGQEMAQALYRCEAQN